MKSTAFMLAILIWGVNMLCVLSRCLELPCPPGKKTDNPRGTCCVFPFNYGGKTYNACTTEDHSGLWCSLTAAYSGSWANCVGSCYRRPCENGGVCTETKNDSYSCDCAMGYSGDNCEIAGPCAKKPCRNEGICTETGNNSRSCECAAGYSGEDCEKKLPCPPGQKTDNRQGACCVFPFIYRGTTYNACTMADHSGFWCSLTATYSGNWAHCVGPCHKNPCLNGGVCTDTKNDSYNCKCAGGYSGNNCEIAGQCVKKPCQNGGICTENGNNSRSCECTAGYSGENCEKKLPCPPGKKTDNHQGACCVFPFIYKGTTYNACTMADYSRLWCSLTAIYSTPWANCVGPCDKNPCLNGGFCTATKNDSYNCKCAGGYSGENCEIAGPCAKKPCQNGGICTETGNNSRSCECAAGYSGENCEKKLPCPPGKKTDNHQGACCVFPFIYKGTTYNACTMADYSRLWCSLTPTYSSSWANCVAPCHKNPCLNGGVCTDTKNDSYNCKCTGGYSGNNCEIAGPCAKKPCQNGGICSKTGNNSRSCECAAGYSGENCEKKLPCPPGKKTDNHQGACCVFPFTYGGTTYSTCTMAAHNRLWCSLTATYSGSWANCVGPCHKNPCLNGGVCTKTRNDSYNCKCAGGYSGDNCEIVGLCAKKPCQNGGICTQTGNNSRSCECAAGYSGQNCEKKLPCPPGKKTHNPQGACCVFPFTYGGTTYNACTMAAHSQLWCSLTATYSGSWANCVGPCHKNPCLNGGVCTETKNDSYNCKCAGGYSGDNCETAGPCAKRPCQNGGICTKTGNNSRTCECIAEYSGENCEKKLPCPPGRRTDNTQGACCTFPFTYGGMTYNACTMVDHSQLWCTLKAGYSRSWANCVGPCHKNPCLNEGVCTETQNDSYNCKCAGGYSGDNCEIEGPCAKKPCQNGGICTQTGNNSRSCKCTAEYSGENCEKKLPCLPGRKTDNPQGACCVFPFIYGGKTYNACTMADHSRLWCTLRAGYSRSWANCVGPCSKNPCLNGGVCTETKNDTYNCKCVGGYSGESCEIAGPCAKKPCQNGGICTETGNNSRSCECAVGYFGENCEKKLPCSTGKKTDNARGACCVFPFTYNGKTYNSCTMDAWHRLWCSLTATYSGSWANCISSCAKNPCQNGGVCAETQDNSYSCKCVAGYSGVNCEDASDGWRSEGCFKVLKKGEKIVYEKRFADINGTGEMKCNVKTAFELCKVAAEEKGYEMFGILGVREMKTGRR